jgi:hypothetical protein
VALGVAVVLLGATIGALRFCPGKEIKLCASGCCLTGGPDRQRRPRAQLRPDKKNLVILLANVPDSNEPLAGHNYSTMVDELQKHYGSQVVGKEFEPGPGYEGRMAIIHEVSAETCPYHGSCPN